jgi:hypothetical protein
VAIGPWLRERRDDCESAFGFLVDGFGYEVRRRRFRNGGFEIGYTGAGVGVLVDWFPRDPMSVWLVRTPDGVLPPRGEQTGLDYFDLEDFEAIAGKAGASIPVDLYTPSEANALHLAGRLRACGPDLLVGGAADPFPALEQRVRARAEEFVHGLEP